MQSCTNCLLKFQDYPAIHLDENGVCDICNTNLNRLKQVQKNIENKKIESLLKSLQKVKSKYNCLIGISGGLDSSYLVLKAMEWGLNPLLLHIDGGWNTAQAQENIKKIIKISGFDYETVVLDWEALKDFQYAFLQAHVIDIDLPFDNLLLSYMYRTAAKHGIKDILMGYNSTTEGIMPSNFTHYKNDKLNILDIHSKFGKKIEHPFYFFGTTDHIWYEKIKKIKFIEPLDLMEYNQIEAKEAIKNKFNWIEIKDKHHENLFTKFYQDYILIEKFNVFKYKSHLSILICSGQLTKTEANDKYSDYLKKRLHYIEEDKAYFCKKMGFTKEEFDMYINTKPIEHTFYKSELNIYKKIKPLYRFVKKIVP